MGRLCRHLPILTTMDALIIPTYNRADYLRSTLQTVLRALDTNVAVLLTDDGSIGQEVMLQCKDFIHQAAAKGVYAELLTGEHVGVAGNMVRGIDRALLMPGIAQQLTAQQFIITLDSDFVVKPDFFVKLRWLMQTQGNDHTICTGFNAITHPIIKQCDGFAVKRSIGGGNQAYNLLAYYRYIKPSLVNNMWDWTVCNTITKNGGRLLCVTPSICQHIGLTSILAHKPDQAVDYGYQEAKK